ncbi:hypothetical protein ACJDU8_13545 [Clostridium sp. WILCCON 0269]|uniref:Uncharacterized protein n=1 Tax=Candidatus Clostridium eludens TaxID=3381663 RepID=A0ABW8SKJ1_9CLOT
MKKSVALVMIGFYIKVSMTWIKNNDILTFIAIRHLDYFICLN